MSNYTINPGTENWAAPLNSTLADVDSRLTALEDRPQIPGPPGEGGDGLTFVSAPLESPPTSGTSLWRIT